MSETPAPAAPDASTIVAQSLGTVGYAMFSLCQFGPVEAVESFTEVMRRGGTFQPTSVTIGGEDGVADSDDDAAPTFGESTVDENLGAVTPVAVPDETADAPFVPPVVPQGHVAASSALMALGPDGRPLGGDPAAPSADPAAQAAPAAAPAGPAPALPDYHNNSGQSLAMLQDINFIEE